MKAKHVVGLLILGMGMRHIDSLFDLAMTEISNWQALHTAKVQLQLNDLLPEGQGEQEDIVIGGFGQHIYDENDYEEVYEDE